jgi:putative flippase GtrA
MKKKNLKSLQLQKSTISSLHSYSVNGGTDVIVDIATIVIIRTTDYATKTGCSQLAACDSISIYPQGVAHTKFVGPDTQPETACARGDY